MLTCCVTTAEPARAHVDAGELLQWSCLAPDAFLCYLSKQPFCALTLIEMKLDSKPDTVVWRILTELTRQAAWKCTAKQSSSFCLLICKVKQHRMGVAYT